MVASCVAACAPFEKNSIPGAKNNVVKLEGIPVSTVLSALKIQLAKAIVIINKIKKDNPDHPISTLNLKPGSGKITATIKSVRGNNGSVVKSVIPFSGFAGSTLTPTLGADWSAESTRIEEFAFKIAPDLKSGSIEVPGLENVEIGTAVEDALVAHYNDLLRIPVPKIGSSYGPSITAQSLTMTFNFIAQQKTNGKIEIKFIPSSPTFSEVSPTLSGNSEKTVGNQLIVALPFDTGDSNDSRRLFYAVKGAEGNLYVEEPYTEERYKELLSKTQKPKNPDSKIPPGPWIFPFNKNLIPPARLESNGSLTPESDPEPF